MLAFIMWFVFVVDTENKEKWKVEHEKETWKEEESEESDFIEPLTRRERSARIFLVT